VSCRTGFQRYAQSCNRTAREGGWQVADRVISNPIINSPYRDPARHFAFDNDGITDRIVEGRRESSYFVPVPRPRKRGAHQQLEFAELTADQIEKNQFVNDIRVRIPIESVHPFRSNPYSGSGVFVHLAARL
jgi:hypothetical protein